MDAAEARRAADDRRLVRLAQSGDTDAVDALVARFRPLALGLAKDYFHASLSPDDFRQEALLGLVRGVEAFRPDDKYALPWFLQLCITRSLITALKTAQRGKHEVMTWALRVGESEEGTEVDATGLAHDQGLPAHDRVVAGLELADLALRIRRDLTYPEAAALLAVANGVTYAAAEPIVGGWKALDNALQRARRKLDGPPSRPFPPTHPCPGCEGVTVRRRPDGRVAGSRPGRPPFCNVCRFRADAARITRGDPVPYAA